MSAETPDDEAARRLQGHLDAECCCDPIPVEPHRVGDPHPPGTFDLTAPTPGTPATTEAAAYLDRDGDMWIPSGNPAVLLRLDPDCWVSRDDLTDVVRFYGPLVPLVREDVAAMPDGPRGRKVVAGNADSGRGLA